MEPKKIAHSLIIATIVTIVFITGLTICGDLYPSIKDWLKNLFSHHWIGKGILSLDLYLLTTILLMILPHSVKMATVVRSLWILFYTAVAGTAMLAAFYYLEAIIFTQ